MNATAVAVDNTEHLRRLGTAIITDPRISAADWEQLVLVVIHEGSQWRISGFGYNQNDPAKPNAFPLAPTGLDVSKAAGLLRDVMKAQSGTAGWLACKVYIHRITGVFTTKFENDDLTALRITSENLEQMALTLRPQA